MNNSAVNPEDENIVQLVNTVAGIVAMKYLSVREGDEIPWCLAVVNSEGTSNNLQPEDIQSLFMHMVTDVVQLLMLSSTELKQIYSMGFAELLNEAFTNPEAFATLASVATDEQMQMLVNRHKELNG